MNILEKIQKTRNLPQVYEEPETAVAVGEEVMPSEEKKSFVGFFREIGKKLMPKPFPWKFINLKNALIAGCLALIAVAGYLNVKYGSDNTTPILTEEPSEPSGIEEKDKTPEPSYFASAVIDRERARGEALEVLVSIAEDDDADTAARDEAYRQMERIANETSWEIDIENLVKAKGFAECIAVINDNSASVVVKSEGLTPGEVAQIKEIVYLSSEIEPKDIKIIEKN